MDNLRFFRRPDKKKRVSFQCLIKGKNWNKINIYETNSRGHYHIELFLTGVGGKVQ